MKQWEIIREAQENSAKIRRGHWTGRQYIIWNKDHWINEKGLQCNSTPLGAVDWELYIEPIRTFGPDRAMYWLERGKFVIRKGQIIQRRLSRHIDTIRDFTGFVFSGIWFYDDWHLCDENGNYVPEPEEGR